MLILKELWPAAHIVHICATQRSNYKALAKHWRRGGIAVEVNYKNVNRKSLLPRALLLSPEQTPHPPPDRTVRLTKPRMLNTCGLKMNLKKKEELTSNNVLHHEKKLAAHKT